MQKWIIVVESDCVDPAREKEYHEWYDKIHVPDIMETEGFVRGKRYEMHKLTKSTGEKPRFLAMYEIEADDLDAVMEKHAQNMAKKEAEGRLSKLINSTIRAIYKQISEYP